MKRIKLVWKGIKEYPLIPLSLFLAIIGLVKFTQVVFSSTMPYDEKTYWLIMCLVLLGISLYGSTYKISKVKKSDNIKSESDAKNIKLQ